MSIKSGDIFQLGEHTLGCGSSTDRGFVQQVIGTQTIHAIITDPPYGVAVVESTLSNNNKHKKILNDHLQTDQEYIQFTQSWLDLVKCALAKKNSVYIFNSDKMIFALREAMVKSGCKLSQLLIWVKSQPVVGRLDYLPMHELIAYGWYGTHVFHKSKDKSVLFYPKPAKNTWHPTVKPIALIRHLILNSTQVGDVVYDPFLGSGTALLAADQTLRKCIGIEMEPEYCEVIIRRWERLSGQKAVLKGAR